MNLSDYIIKVRDEISSLNSVYSCEIVNASAVTYDDLNLKANVGSHVFVDFIGISEVENVRANGNNFAANLSFNIYVFAKRDKKLKAFSLVAADSVQEIVNALHRNKFGFSDVLNYPQDIAFTPTGATEINNNNYEQWQINFNQKVKMNNTI